MIPADHFDFIELPDNACTVARPPEGTTGLDTPAQTSGLARRPAWK